MHIWATAIRNQHTTTIKHIFMKRNFTQCSYTQYSIENFLNCTKCLYVLCAPLISFASELATSNHVQVSKRKRGEERTWLPLRRVLAALSIWPAALCAVCLVVSRLESDCIGWMENWFNVLCTNQTRIRLALNRFTSVWLCFRDHQNNWIGLCDQVQVAFGPCSTQNLLRSRRAWIIRTLPCGRAHKNLPWNMMQRRGSYTLSRWKFHSDNTYGRGLLIRDGIGVAKSRPRETFRITLFSLPHFHSAF